MLGHLLSPAGPGAARGGLRPIEEIARELGLADDAWSPFGRWIAKIDPRRVLAPETRRPGKIVLVTGMTPTGGGVGKTVTTLALASALHRLGLRSIACLRQPSLGPVFGIKGGGAGGGRATVEPAAEVNLGLTGDLDAVTNAHNLLASLVDNHLHHGNPLGLDPETVDWPRALDLEDRALRQIEIGRGPGNGPVRKASFIITPASEVTAILGLARSPSDLRQRLDRIEVGRNRSGAFVTAGDLGAGGAMAALLRHAVQPNLLQTPEGAPVLVHGGPFGNLSYGTTTLASLEVARRLADIVVVEAGFATDLGAEKFVDLFAPVADVQPCAAVLVASLPGLRAHAVGSADPRSLGPGLENLDQHLANLEALGLAPVVALNRHPDDDPAGLAAVRAHVGGASVRIEDSNGFVQGAAGSLDLAHAVAEATREGRTARPLYSPSQSLLEKIDTIVRRLYGGDGVDLDGTAQAQLVSGELPEADSAAVCLAKTPLSLSDDPKKLGRPRGFRVRVRRFVRATGSGYLVALLGDIQTMPGLPREPRAFRITTDALGLPEGVE
jgi:formate--tetrahydrofolate ligase